MEIKIKNIETKSIDKNHPSVIFRGEDGSEGIGQWFGNEPPELDRIYSVEFTVREVLRKGKSIYKLANGPQNIFLCNESNTFIFGAVEAISQDNALCLRIGSGLLDVDTDTSDFHIGDFVKIQVSCLEIYDN